MLSTIHKLRGNPTKAIEFSFIVAHLTPKDVGAWEELMEATKWVHFELFFLCFCFLSEWQGLYTLFVFRNPCFLVFLIPNNTCITEFFIVAHLTPKDVGAWEELMEATKWVFSFFLTCIKSSFVSHFFFEVSFFSLLHILSYLYLVIQSCCETELVFVIVCFVVNIRWLLWATKLQPSRRPTTHLHLHSVALFFLAVVLHHLFGVSYLSLVFRVVLLHRNISAWKSLGNKQARRRCCPLSFFVL